MKIISDYFKLEFSEKTFLTSLFSIFITVAFAIYNGALGILHHSLWYGGICIYYLLLMVARFIIQLFRHNESPKIVPFFVYFILLVINISMIVPAISLLRGEKSYEWGLIPAIAMAAYTTYSIVMAIVNVKRSGKTKNIYVKQIRLIKVISCLMSVLVLQNTLIVANGGMNEAMVHFSAYSTFGILALSVLITMISILKFSKHLKEKNV